MDEHRDKILVVFVLNYGNVSSHYYFSTYFYLKKYITPSKF
jgi:hypothetical protein